MVLLCSACGARNDPGLKLHRFPKSLDRCNEWAELIDRPDLIDLSQGDSYEYYGLCSDHFRREDFDGEQLKDGVNPSIFDCKDGANDQLKTLDDDVDKRSDVVPPVSQSQEVDIPGEFDKCSDLLPVPKALYITGENNVDRVDIPSTSKMPCVGLGNKDAVDPLIFDDVPQSLPCDLYDSSIRLSTLLREECYDDWSDEMFD